MSKIVSKKVGNLHAGDRLYLQAGRGGTVYINEVHISKPNNAAWIVTQEADGSFQRRAYANLHKKVKVKV